MATLDRVSELGDYLREQRQGAKLTLRQLAEVAGVSNPYLSQVERGLRKPSAEVLQQIARGLRISAEVLYVRAGILEEREDRITVEAAVLADPKLTERQRRVLLDIYATFCAEHARDGEPAPTPARSRSPRAAARRETTGTRDTDGTSETTETAASADGVTPATTTPTRPARKRAPRGGN